MLAWATCASAQTVSGERISYDFRVEPLELVLDTIARDTAIDLVYEPRLVSNKEVFERVEDLPVLEALRRILEDHNLDYLTLSSGTIVIIKRVEGAPAFGALSGIIIDGRTGEPLHGATVILADSEGGTSAGRMGDFTLNRLISGSHTLIFSFVGYQAVTKVIQISPGDQVRETVELRPEPVSVAPIVVEAHRPQIYHYNPDAGAGQPLNGSGFFDYNKNPISELSLIPGVSSGVPMNDISIQGGQASEHRLLLDGAPIYTPNAPGRFYSTFSPYAIGSVKIQRAGYDASRGSQMAGLINMTHRLPAAESGGAMLQADPVSINLRGDVSFDLNGEAALSATALFRSNLWSVYRDPALDQTFREWSFIDPLIANRSGRLSENATLYTPFDRDADLTFHDFHTAVRYKPGRYQTINFSFYSSGNRLDTGVLNRSVPEQDIKPFLFSTERYYWRNRMAQVSWSSLPSSRLSIDTQVSYTRSIFDLKSELGFGIPSRFTNVGSSSVSLETGDFSFDQLALPSRIHGNKIGHLILRSDLTYSMSPNVELAGGLQFDRVQSEVYTDTDPGTQTFTDLADAGSSLASGYGEANIRFGRYWHVTAGSRLTYHSGRETVFAEPRFSVQLDRPGADIGYWSAKISGGLYRQFINEYRVSSSGASALIPTFSVWSHSGRLPVPKAYHMTGSWLVEPSTRQMLRIEAYLKWQPTTSITSYRQPAVENSDELPEIFAETTDMRALGGAIRYERTLIESTLKMMAGYDYSSSIVNMQTQFGRRVETPWNDPHRGQIRLFWSPSAEFTIIGKWQGVWGRKWAFRDAYYNILGGEVAGSLPGISLNSPGDDRLSPVSQLDFSGVYQASFDAATLEFRVDLVNVLNRRNEVERYLRPVIRDGVVTGYDIGRRTLPGFFPTFSVKVSI